MRNLRAICPNCGGKIHTQPKGLGHLTWANSWVFAQTGKECQHCGVALTGKVKADGKAELVPAPEPKAAPAVLPQGEGWWPDPALRYRHRYFNGRFWTDRVRDGQGNELIDSKPVATPR